VNMGSIERILVRGVDEDLFSRAVVRGFTAERNVFVARVGDVSNASIFDIASLTKIFTAFIVALIREEGGITGEEVASLLLGINSDSFLSRVNVEHLLSHTSGLPPWEPLYEGLLGPVVPFQRPGREEVKRLVVEKILNTPVEHRPGEKIIYSDLGYILLGFVVEAITGKSLDSVLEESVASPLGLSDTCYLPNLRIPHCDSGRIVSTGYCEVRKKEKVGEVDDLNCAALGGVAGHAGIFSTASDLEKFGKYLLRSFEEEVLGNRDGPLSYMLREVRDSEGDWRFLGFDAAQGPNSLAGSGFSPLTAGHLGWTGTSIWLDFGNGRGVLFLSDRVAVGGDREKFNEVRRKIHTEAWRIMDE